MTDTQIYSPNKSVNFHEPQFKDLPKKKLQSSFPYSPKIEQNQLQNFNQINRNPHNQIPQIPQFQFNNNLMQQNQVFDLQNPNLATEVFVNYEPVETKYIEYQTIKKIIQVPVHEEIIEYVPCTNDKDRIPRIIQGRMQPDIISEGKNPYIGPQYLKNKYDGGQQMQKMSNSKLFGRQPYENIFK